MKDSLERRTLLWGAIVAIIVLVNAVLCYHAVRVLIDNDRLVNHTREVSNELTRTGIEDAYAKLIGDARNQYTLGYQTHEPPIGGYRSIEVLVSRPNCRRSSIRPCVDLTAKDGYYPAPPAR